MRLFHHLSITAKLFGAFAVVLIPVLVIDIIGAPRIVMIVLALADLTLGLTLALWLARAISAPLLSAVEAARRIGAGDLTWSLPDDPGRGRSRDETAQLLQAMATMNQGLLALVGDIGGGTRAIAAALVEIARGNLDLSIRTEQQAASLEETASAMEELSATVKQNAGNAAMADKLATSASAVALRGGDDVAQVVATMASIHDSSQKIAEIIGVIDGIAFQTNILALNAAVEAARAGEQGRGFAVVASEVRNLAQRSAAAAREIKTLIDDSVDKVVRGTELADKAGRTMQEVVGSVKRVSDLIGDIASASAEQTTGLEQIHEAISTMDRGTQENAALVEQATAAASAMREQTCQLSELLAALTIDDGFSDHAQPPPQPPRIAAPRKPLPPPRKPVPTRNIPPGPASLKLSRSGTRLGASSAGNAGDVEWEEF
jgi:methyl-accepting chemotaxis protein